MPNLPNTTNAQTYFLRAFHNNPAGPAPEDWPSPAVFRRWLRKPAFRFALNSILQTIRQQSRLQLFCAGLAATQTLGESLTNPPQQPQEPEPANQPAQPNPTAANTVAADSTNRKSQIQNRKSSASLRLCAQLLALTHRKPPRLRVKSPPKPPSAELDLLQRMHPDITLGQALNYVKVLKEQDAAFKPPTQDHVPVPPDQEYPPGDD